MYCVRMWLQLASMLCCISSVCMPRQEAGKEVRVGDYLVAVNSIEVLKMKSEDLVRILQATPPPRTFKLVRITGAAAGATGQSVRPPPNAVVYTVESTAPSVGLQLSETRIGFMVRGFTPSTWLTVEGRWTMRASRA